MRQLLVRVDDDLHAGLRERASAEGRSVNALVNEVLTAAIEGREGRREHLRRKAGRSGVLAASLLQPAARYEKDVTSAATAGRRVAKPRRDVTVLYADAGAILGAYLPDHPDHPALRGVLLEGPDPVVSSEVVRVEVAAAFAERPRSRELLGRFDADCGTGGALLLLRLVAERTLAAAAELARAHGLGPLGAIHVVTALAVAAPLAAPEPLVFVTRDERRREAAEAFGLPTAG